MKKEWRDVKGYEGHYMVSNMGTVKSLTRKIPMKNGRSRTLQGVTLRPRKDKHGYLSAGLWINRKMKNPFIHRLAAIAFIPNPHKKPLVNHKDSNPLNNRIENLEWCTYSENMIHAKENGRLNPPIGSRSGMSKLTESKVLEIRDLLDGGTDKNQSEIADMYGVAQHTISFIKDRKTWKHI